MSGLCSKHKEFNPDCTLCLMHMGEMREPPQSRQDEREYWRRVYAG